MGPENSGRQRSRLYLGCKILAVVAIIGIAIVFISLGWWLHGNSVENDKRDALAFGLKQAIEAYYETHNSYPAALKDLLVASEESMRSYIDSPVFRYRSGSEDGQAWYHLICVHAGIFTTRGSSHKLSWSGIQCASDTNYLDLSPGMKPEPDERGFCAIDLH